MLRGEEGCIDDRDGKPGGDGGKARVALRLGYGCALWSDCVIGVGALPKMQLDDGDGLFRGGG